ncbi:hypothetical protein H6F74_15135 [Trichocoleus sp. FACHB-90]|nr:hypothetical protein [Trichocoleus sp. FACHB-90]MBD1927568.1 hypothetical protein [Trichocoleus sp. FACHB-90]
MGIGSENVILETGSDRKVIVTLCKHWRTIDLIYALANGLISPQPHK